MDIVIPLANKKSSDWEIRYCLRSIDKYANADRVFLVGRKPEFVTNVVHLPLMDSYVVKDNNIINKILYACFKGVSREFIRMSDDEYFLAPYEPAFYSIGNLKEVKGEGWHKTAFNTRDILSSKKRPTLNYDCHCPQLLDRDLFVDTILDSTWAQGDGVLANSFYFNSIPMVGVPSTPEMVRYKKPQESYDFGNAAFLNHNDEGLTPLLKSKIEELFPEKSKYEI